MKTSGLWLWFDSGKEEAALNMATDEALLNAMPALQKPVLRFYGWTQPAASFGYFQNFADVEALTPLRPLVRRPTGGGIVPHDADWTYSAAFPAGHPWYELQAIESYRAIHDWIRRAFLKLALQTELAPEQQKSGLGQCFRGHERFDLLHHGSKIAGAAQRRTRAGLLIQGSVQPPQPDLPRGDWQNAMLTTAGGAAWEKFTPTPEFRETAARLTQEKFGAEWFVKKR